ncbi:MAG: helix-turn-helix domain-containing protein [Oscillospiraceae bacterium]|nr:helix-turn-helix domain-containing protein [Oscillospiraceae bacterium]
METNEKLTAANIRYLLTMKAFVDAGKEIRNAYLAKHLHYKKSSVHAMLNSLVSIGMIQKDDKNVIHLTEKGADTAVRYQAYYNKIESMMQKCFPDLGSREGAILALLAEIPEQDLQRFCSETTALKRRNE